MKYLRKIRNLIGFVADLGGVQGIILLLFSVVAFVLVATTAFAQNIINADVTLKFPVLLTISTLASYPILKLLEFWIVKRRTIFLFRGLRWKRSQGLLGSTYIALCPNCECQVFYEESWPWANDRHAPADYNPMITTYECPLHGKIDNVPDDISYEKLQMLAKLASSQLHSI